MNVDMEGKSIDLFFFDDSIIFFFRHRRQFAVIHEANENSFFIDTTKKNKNMIITKNLLSLTPSLIWHGPVRWSVLLSNENIQP